MKWAVALIEKGTIIHINMMDRSAGETIIVSITDKPIAIGSKPKTYEMNAGLLYQFMDYVERFERLTSQGYDVFVYGILMATCTGPHAFIAAGAVAKAFEKNKLDDPAVITARYGFGK